MWEYRVSVHVNMSGKISLRHAEDPNVAKQLVRRIFTSCFCTCFIYMYIYIYIYIYLSKNVYSMMIKHSVFLYLCRYLDYAKLTLKRSIDNYILFLSTPTKNMVYFLVLLEVKYVNLTCD